MQSTLTCKCQPYSYHTIQSTLHCKDHSTATILLLGAASTASLVLPPLKCIQTDNGNENQQSDFVMKMEHNKNIAIRYPVLCLSFTTILCALYNL